MTVGLNYGSIMAANSMEFNGVSAMESEFNGVSAQSSLVNWNVRVIAKTHGCCVKNQGGCYNLGDDRGHTMTIPDPNPNPNPKPRSSHGL